MRKAAGVKNQQTEGMQGNHVQTRLYRIGGQRSFDSTEGPSKSICDWETDLPKNRERGDVILVYGTNQLEHVETAQREIRWGPVIGG